MFRNVFGTRMSPAMDAALLPGGLDLLDLEDVQDVMQSYMDPSWMGTGTGRATTYGADSMVEVAREDTYLNGKDATPQVRVLENRADMRRISKALGRCIRKHNVRMRDKVQCYTGAQAHAWKNNKGFQLVANPLLGNLLGRLQ